MTEAKFLFSGNSSQFTKALGQVKKSMQQVAKQTVLLQAGLKLLSATVNAVAKTLSTVLGAAIKGIVNIVKGALNAIKSLVTGAIKFIRTALTTLLSWITKALGKVFDWIGNMFNAMGKVAAKTVDIAKKTIKQIAQSVQAYADKEYNSIQLKVSLGDSYEAVMKDFKNLVKYTTADRNDLLSVYATFAELGKSPEDVTKYARAAVYLSNATGRSLSQITRLLLGQEAAGRDLEKVLNRVGVSLSGQEESVSNVEKIINQLDSEMTALATGSLNQVFANIKNDIIAIRENIGYIFSGPVRYVAQRIDKILDRIANSDKIDNLANKIDELFTKKIQPIVDDIFDAFEKIIQDPAGFFEALWKDISANFKWLKDNFEDIFKTFGEIIGHVTKDIVTLITNISWDKVWESLSKFGEGLSSFVIQIGHGAGIFSDEDVIAAEGSLLKAIRNAWNRAHPDFELKDTDTWYQNLGTLLSATWELAIKPLWNDTIKPEIIDPFIDWIKGPFATVMGTIFTWLGEVLSSTFTNLLLQSNVLRTIMSAIGMPIATRQDQTSSYDKVKQWLPQTIVDGNAWRDFRSTDLNHEFLNSRYTGKGFTGTWLQYLETVSGLVGEDLNLLRRVARADNITENATVPTISDLFNRIDAALNPAKDGMEDAVETMVEAVDDTTEVITGTLIPTLSEADKALKDAERELKSHVVTLHVQGTSTGYGKGGIQDYYGQNEFKVYPYAKGGLVHKPTLALIGEAGPELVIPVKNLTKLADGYGKDVIPIDTEWYSNIWDNASKDAGTNMGHAPGFINVSDFFNTTETLLEGISDNTKDDRTTLEKVVDWTSNAWKNIKDKKFWEGVWDKVIDTWDDVKTSVRNVVMFVPEMARLMKQFNLHDWGLILDGIWKGVTTLVKGVTKGLFGYVGGVAGFFAKNGGFGSHIGNIYSGSFDENGTFSILKMFGAIIQELLPYLQKGLEIIGPLFDQAFDILGNAVQILGERLGKVLMPILEAFVPFMKTLADIVIALAPVVESVLAPAIRIIAFLLEFLTGVLDKLMPIFAILGATIQWISDRIEYAIAGVINWLASWIPWVSSVEQKKPKSWQEYHDDILGTYNKQKENPVGTTITASAGTASATASYNGATTVYMTNDFSGAYVVGNNGFRELALIIKNTLQDIDYVGQSV